MDADVVVIGAGALGLSTALQSRRWGADVREATAAQLAEGAGSVSALASYGAVILSDIGANSLLLAPDTFERSAIAPNRLAVIEQYVRDGGGLLMIGGYFLLRRDRRQGSLPRHPGRDGAAGHHQRSG